MTIQYIEYWDNGRVAREKINSIMQEVEASIPSIWENWHWYIWWVDTWITAVWFTLREWNNLIQRNANLEAYVDLQIATWITPSDEFQVWVTVGKVLETDGWDQDWLLLNRQTTNGEYARWIYGNDWKLYFDCGDGVWNQIYLASDVNGLFTTLRSELWAVAFSNDYTDLDNKPTIWNGKLSIQRNGTLVNEITMNSTSNVTANISVPTKTSDITNDSWFITKEVADLTNYTPTSSLGAVALSNDYSDLNNLPDIPDAVSDLDNDLWFIDKDVDDLTNYTKTSDLPTVWTAKITIQKNWSKVDDFGVNATSDKTINITMSKSDVWLWNVDNTSDLNKPISTATQNALDGKQATISDLSTIRDNATAGKWASDTIATYGDIVTHDVSEFATASQGWKADTAVQPWDLWAVATSNDYTDLDNKPTIWDATITIQKNSTNVDSFKTNATANKTIDIQLSKSDVGLWNVNNTSDADKPISTATQSALDWKQDVLVAGTNIQIASDGKTISSTDTTYTAWTWLSLNGTEFSNAWVTSVNGNTWAVTINQVSDTAFWSSWDGVTWTAPSKNAVYDKVSGIDTSISTIEWKIPSQATSTNQLADKAFVNSSINSVTAYYITKNANGDQFATHAELTSATTFYSGWVARTPTRNDYCIVADDEDHDHATTRYIYNSGWEFQYIVNETALTQGQLDALNSWITSGKVTSYDSAVSTIGWYGNIVTHNTSEFATSTQWWKADTALQPNDNISQLTNNVWYITSSALPTKVSDLQNDTGFITSSALSGYQTTANMVTDLTNPDNTHYPTTKAISDALVDLWAWDMLKSVYDPNNIWADAFDYTNFINTPTIPDAQIQSDWTQADNTKKDYIKNKPTIPTVNNAKITVQKNWTKVKDFTLNQSTDETINITVPTKVSDLSNDTWFITSSSLPTKVSDLQNDTWFITSSSLPTATSDLTNDSWYITSADIPTNVSDFTNDAWYITSASLPTVNNNKITIQKNGTKVDDFTLNQSSDKTINIAVPTKTSDITNDSWYITKSVNDLTNYTLTSSLSSVATSGDYWDLNNLPTIPADTADLTNGAWFITAWDLASGSWIWISWTTISNTWVLSVNGNTWAVTVSEFLPWSWTAGQVVTKTSSWYQYSNIPSQVSDTAYASSWDGVTSTAPSKNAVYDKIQSVIASIPTVPTNISAFTNDAWYITWITSGDVTTALWFTPYDSANPSWYVTSSIINDTAYWSGWNSDTTHAPTKNAVYDKISAMDTTISWKQDILVSWTNIKTVNWESLLWSGNLTIPNYAWVTKTISNDEVEIWIRTLVNKPAGNFTITKPATLVDGEEYTIRIINNASVTITLWTWITNPRNVDLSTSQYATDQLVFLSIGGELELQPISASGTRS